MADWHDVRQIALRLPETAELPGRGGAAQWRVKDKLFVWERPLGKSDLAALGAGAPTGPIAAARVADLGVKEAMVADPRGIFFTMPHFDGYPAILLRLADAEVAELTEVIVEAWLARAPARLVKAFGEGLTELT